MSASKWRVSTVDRTRHLEPTLTRHGYKMRDLAEELGVKSREIKALFHNQLELGRSKELLKKMLAAGLPI